MKTSVIFVRTETRVMESGDELQSLRFVSKDLYEFISSTGRKSYKRASGTIPYSPELLDLIQQTGEPITIRWAGRDENGELEEMQEYQGFAVAGSISYAQSDNAIDINDDTKFGSVGVVDLDIEVAGTFKTTMETLEDGTTMYRRENVVPKATQVAQPQVPQTPVAQVQPPRPQGENLVDMQKVLDLVKQLNVSVPDAIELVKAGYSI